MSEEVNVVDLSGLGNFDFTPAWAKKEAGVSVGKVRPSADRPGDDRPERGPRKPAGDGGRKPFGRPPFAKKPSGGGAERRPRFEERPRPLDVEVKILPETKALGTIIRKLQNDVHAYKLKDLAYFFLDNPNSILLKITPKAVPSTSNLQPSTSNLQPPTSFVQCKACGFASVREADVIDHILTAHLGDYYVAKEIDCEPPKGNFSCVAKCGLSGVLLGPPNIHEFGAVVKEMIRTKYPEMSEEQYRAHIEMVRDAETIEAWRAGATKKTVFFAKGTADTEGAPSLTREQAEGEFRRTILPSLVDRPKNLMITADVAMASPVKPLVWAVRDAIEAERRAPYGMCFALRGAFHHRKLKFFRVNDARGQEFVTNVDLKPFDAEHAIPELKAMAEFIDAHPCCDKSELPQNEDAAKHLAWLVTTGHVVSFTNGVYSKVEKYPKYGPQWKKRPAAQPLPESNNQTSVEQTSVEQTSVEQTSVEQKSEEQTSEEAKNETTPVVAE